MSKPGEHKTVQARILAYAEAIGWTFVSREEAVKRRGGIPAPRSSGKHGGQECPPSLFFDDLLDAKVREFNPRYAEAEGALLGRFRHLHTDIYGNPPSPGGYGGTSREFVEHLRNPPSPKGYGGTGRGKFCDHEEKRERDLSNSSGWHRSPLLPDHPSWVVAQSIQCATTGVRFSASPSLWTDESSKFCSGAIAINAPLSEL